MPRCPRRRCRRRRRSSSDVAAWKATAESAENADVCVLSLLRLLSRLTGQPRLDNERQSQPRQTKRTLRSQRALRLLFRAVYSRESEGESASIRKWSIAARKWRTEAPCPNAPRPIAIASSRKTIDASFHIGSGPFLHYADCSVRAA